MDSSATRSQIKQTENRNIHKCSCSFSANGQRGGDERNRDMGWCQWGGEGTW